MWTMGDDFRYQYAESWFKQMDKLIHYVNKVSIEDWTIDDDYVLAVETGNTIESCFECD